MTINLAALAGGVVFGFVLAWARVSDPATIRHMLLLREVDVFLIMGSAIATAAGGLRLLRGLRMRALLTGDVVSWVVQQPERRHVIGSVLFGAGWSVAGTCPGPAAAMLGAGSLMGLAVVAGLFAGVALQQRVRRSS